MTEVGDGRNVCEVIGAQGGVGECQLFWILYNVFFLILKGQRLIQSHVNWHILFALKK